ncbi:MAG: hypothetical protein LBB83_05620, partial [Treponema sp.]|nr:hypothetical protein [Treponema sp.]
TKFVDKNLSRKTVPGTHAGTLQGRAMDDSARAFPAKRCLETVPGTLAPLPEAAQGRAADDGARAFPAKRRRETVPGTKFVDKKLSRKTVPGTLAGDPAWPRSGRQHCDTKARGRRSAARGRLRLNSYISSIIINNIEIPAAPA